MEYEFKTEITDRNTSHYLIIKKKYKYKNHIINLQLITLTTNGLQFG